MEIPCTTCGAREYREGLEAIGPEQVILDLGQVSELGLRHGENHFVDAMTKWLYFRGNVRGPDDLIAIKGTPVWDYFSDFCRNYWEREKRIAQQKERERVELAEARRIRAELTAEKATHSLINAIRRKDYKAIQALLDKGADPVRYQDFWGTSGQERIRSLDGYAFEFQGGRWLLIDLSDRGSS